MSRIKRKSRHKFNGGKRMPMKAIRKANRKRKPSSLELLIRTWLDTDKIKYKHEFPVGQCHVDIMFPPKTLVELNGCFWHKHWCLEPKEGWSLKDKATQIKDVRRIQFLRSKGFEVTTIWECDVKDNPEDVRRRLKILAKDAKKDKE